MGLPKKINFQIIAWTLFYILIFSFLLHNSLSYLDNDLGWHLKVGEQIISERSVPNLEYYDYTLEGKTWVDHEWLLNLFSFFVYDNFGFVFLNIIFSLLMVAVFIMLTVFTKKYIKDRNGDIVIMFFQAFGMVAMAPHLGIRMQEIAILNILILLIVIYYYNKNKKNKILLWLLPLFYFWANAHASYLIGIFLLFFWISVKILENIASRSKYFQILNFEKKLDFKKISIFFLFSLLSISATLLTPYGIKLYAFLSDYTNPYYMKHIMEWLPIYYYPIQYKQAIYLAMAVAILSLLIYNAIRFVKYKGKLANLKEHKIDLWHFFLFLLFFVLAIKSKRHFPLFFIVSFPLIIDFLTTEFNFSKKILALNRKDYLIVAYLIITTLSVSTIFLTSSNYTRDPFNAKFYCRSFPCQAVDFLKNNEKYKDLKIFNDYGWGGYMIWAWPEKKLFIDGRLPQYKFAEHTMLHEYYTFFDKETLKEKINFYDVRLIMLSVKKPIKLNWIDKHIVGLSEKEINNQKNPLKNYLDNNNWKLIYSDSISLIYVQNK